MDVNHQKFPKRERDPMKSKNFLVQKLPKKGKVRGGGGGGPQSLGTVPNLTELVFVILKRLLSDSVVRFITSR